MKGDKNFYYVLIDFFYKFDSISKLTKIILIVLFFISLSLSLFRSILGTNRWHETFGPWCTSGWNIEHGAIAFLLVSQWNRVEKCDEFQDSNHQATISKDYRYRGKIYIYTHCSTKSSRSRTTIRVIGIPRWEKCMLIQNARLYHDVLLSRNGKWNGTHGRLHHTRHRYIYIYTHVKVVSSDGKNLAQKWNWKLVNYAEYSIETLDGGCRNTPRILSQFFLGRIKSQTRILEFIKISRDTNERTYYLLLFERETKIETTLRKR